MEMVSNTGRVCQGIEKGISNPDYERPLIETLFDIVDLDSDGHISQEEHRLFFSVFGAMLRNQLLSSPSLISIRMHPL
jgi:hypothetical protein